MRKKRRKLGDKGLVTRMIIYIVRQKVLHQIKSEEYNLCNDFLDRKCYNSNKKNGYLMQNFERFNQTLLHPS